MRLAANSKQCFRRRGGRVDGVMVFALPMKYRKLAADPMEKIIQRFNRRDEEDNDASVA